MKQISYGQTENLLNLLNLLTIFLGVADVSSMGHHSHRLFAAF